MTKSDKKISENEKGCIPFCRLGLNRGDNLGGDGSGGPGVAISIKSISVSMITQMVRNSDGGSSNLNGGGLDGNSGCGHNMVGNGLGNMLGDSPGLVQGLVDNGLGLNNRFLGKDGLVFNDGLGDMFGGDDLAGGDMGNGCGLMDHSGFSNGVGDGGKLGGHLGVGMGFSHGVGKVATQPVGLNGGGVMGGGPDQGGGQVTHDFLGAAGSQGQKASENDKSL